MGDHDAPTFKEAVAKWAKEVPGAVMPGVATRYLASIGQLDPVFGNLRMDQISAKTIADYVSSRAGLVTNGTIRRDLTALSRLLAACVSWGWRTDNPALAYDRSMARERRDPITPPGDHEWAVLLEECPEDMAEVLRFLDATGARLNEGQLLEGQEVDEARGQIALIKTKTNLPRTLAWKTPGGDATPLVADARSPGVCSGTTPTSHRTSGR